MATVSLQCRNRTDQDGLAKVRLRIEHNSVQKFITTDLKVKPQYWRDGSVTRGHRKADEINSALRRIESAAQDALTSLRASPRRVTAPRLKRAVEDALTPDDDPVSREGFLDYAEGRIQAEYDNAGTRRSHMTAVTKFRAFLEQARGVSDIEMTPFKLTPSLLEEYMTWESEERGNKVNTVHKTMRVIRRVINMAIRDDLFPQSEYPFDDITLHRERTGKTPVKAEGIEKLERLRTRIEQGETRFVDGGLPSHALRAWLFALYMLGMRWSDVSSLEWGQIRDGRLKYQMRKTSARKDLKIVPKAKDILEYYDGAGSGQWVFPFFRLYAPDEDWDTKNGLGAAIKKTNRRVNQELKKIQAEAGLDVTLTTHVARHSAAQRMLDAGWSIQEVNAALDHKDLSTTEHYLRSIRDDELDDQHENLF
jgi:site-specific recombinase XerD